MSYVDEPSVTDVLVQLTLTEKPLVVPPAGLRLTAAPPQFNSEAEFSSTSFTAHSIPLCAVNNALEPFTENICVKFCVPLIVTVYAINAATMTRRKIAVMIENPRLLVI